jgi:hypothetical protein
MKNKLLTSFLFAAVLVALASTAMASTTWYVNGVSGSNSNNCTSSTTACKTIRHAIALAASGDSIVVAAATYKENLTIGFSLNITGSAAATAIIDGGASNTVINISNASAHVTLSKLTIRNGAALQGAGINSLGTLTLNHSLITANTAQGSGGGIVSGGRMVINSSTISVNTSLGDGGGIWNLGTMTVNDSTINGNKGGANIFATGAGIANSATMAINNSTISGNNRITHGTGGIANLQGTLTISSSTIAGNQGGIYVNSGTLSLQNSIVGNNSGGNCFGPVSSKGYNLSSDGSCKFSGPGDMNNTNPVLGTLGNYGGPTQTIPLFSGSPAIDAGKPTGCTDGLGHLLKTDQRGKPRPDAKETVGCDMGAYEYQGALQTGHCVYVCGSTRCGELTGYCSGSVNGACRTTYDPGQCPVGKPAGGYGSSCGEAIDTTRTCTP